MTDRLVLSVAEAAEALGVSDDLVYELLVESAIADFGPGAALTGLNGAPEQTARGGKGATDSMFSAHDPVRPPLKAGDAPVAVGNDRAPRRRPGTRSNPASTRGPGTRRRRRRFTALVDDGAVQDLGSARIAGRQTG